MVLTVLSFLGSLMIILIVCLILVVDLLVLNDACLVFVVLLSGTLWLVLIALFFLGLLCRAANNGRSTDNVRPDR